MGKKRKHLESANKMDQTMVTIDPNVNNIMIEEHQKMQVDLAEQTGIVDASTKKKMKAMGKSKKSKSSKDSKYEPTKLEDNASQVLLRFKHGCECQDDQCFRGLNPEAVFRHRLNIAELTKAEHDMYLMGVTMACLTDPNQTAKHTERRRLRAQYVYQGRRVCLDAFLYLENCTHYQVKRIRKHLVTHGVAPRVHGNHGKIPHNTFSLNIYQIATEFLKNFVKQQEKTQKTRAVKNAPLHVPPEMTRKTVHNSYKEYCKSIAPSIKMMGYSTFRRFMKVQFPHVKFPKLDSAMRPQTIQNHMNNSKIDVELNKHQVESVQYVTDNPTNLMPIMFANNQMQQENTYYITPMDKVQGGMSYQLTAGDILVNRSDIPLSLANIGSK